MSISLTTLSLNIINLSSTEKFLLTALCFRADQNNEAYSCIERLENDTSLKKRTIEPALKKLRDKNILIYTGKHEGKKRNIPVYRINLEHGIFCREKDLITAIYVFNTGNFCIEMTAKIAGQKDNIKNNIKDNASAHAIKNQKPDLFRNEYDNEIRHMKDLLKEKYQVIPFDEWKIKKGYA